MLDTRLESFGTERILAEAANACGGSAAETVARIVGAARAFSAGAAQFDDVTMLALRRLA
jgi:serine phosphatase RsbU (regulator of sigma subunit)